MKAARGRRLRRGGVVILAAGLVSLPAQAQWGSTPTRPREQPAPTATPWTNTPAKPDAPQTTTPGVPGASVALPVVQPRADGKGFSIEHLDIVASGRTVRAPRVEVVGTSLTQPDLERLFDPRSDEPVAARLKRVSADRIDVPELVVEDGAGSSLRRMTFRDAAFEGVAAGLVSRARVATGAIMENGGSGEAAFGRVEAKDLDLGLAFALSDATGGTVGGRLLSSATVDNVTTEDGAGGSASLASLRVGEVRARAPEGGYVQTLAMAGDTRQPSEDTGKQRRASALLKLVQSVEFGPAELRDLRTKTRDGEGRIAALGYDVDAAGHDRFRLTDLSVGSPDGTVTLADASLEGLDVKKAASLILERTSGGNGVALPVAAPGGSVSVHLGGLAFKARGETGSPDGLDLSVSAVDLKSSHDGDRNVGIVHLDGVRVPLKADGPGKALADLGYGQLAGSISLATGYSPSSRALTLDQVSATGVDLGSIRLSGTIGDVGPEAFSTDRATAIAALAGASLRGATLTVEDSGLAKRLLTATAQREGKSEGEVRDAYSGQVALFAGFVLGGSADARQLGGAVSRFVEKPSRLVVRLTPRDGDGVPVSTLVDIGSPADVFHAFKVESTAE